MGLNPYCSGRWSRTYAGMILKKLGLNVLILIVVEDGLVLECTQVNSVSFTMSLNPYCSGRWSRTPHLF